MQGRTSPFAFIHIQRDQYVFSQIIQQMMAPLQPSDQSFSQWDLCLAQYLRYVYERSSSEASLYAYANNLFSFFRTSSAPGATPRHPEDYTHQDVEAFIHHNSPRGVQAPSISAVNQRLMIIHSFYRYASSYTLLGENGRPAFLTTTPAPTLGFRYGKPRRINRAFSEDELRKFFAVIPNDTVKGLRDRAIFLFYFWTGRRRNEVAHLRWGDLSQGMIIDDQGKRRYGWLYQWIGKGKAGQYDTAELPEPAKAALDAYLKVSGRLASMTPDSPLFIGSEKKVMPITGQAIGQILKKYARAAGLDADRLCVHSFRHAAAQTRYAKGLDLLSIQRFLRHANPNTTYGYLLMLAGTADPGAQLLLSDFGNL